MNIEEKVVVFGAGKMGKMLIEYCNLKKKKVIAIVDNNPQKWGKKIKGIRVYKPQEIVNNDKDVIYLIASVDYSSEIKEQLISMGVRTSGISVFSDYDNLEYLLMKEKGTPIINETKYLILNRPCYLTISYIVSIVINVILRMYYNILMKIVKPSKQAHLGKKYNVSLCAIFRDEADYLKEWIEFHIIIGIQHFYLYNNFSKDHYMVVLEEYIKKGVVTLVDWPIERGQMKAYQDCVNKYSGESKWIGFFDIDEFCVLNQHHTVYEFLNRFDYSAPIVLINWKYFGSSGLIERDVKNNLVIEDFVVSWPKYSDIGKFFYNTAYKYNPSRKYGEHMHYMWAKYNNFDIPPINVFGQICIGRFFPMKSDQLPLQLNHYVTKSYKEYFEKKSKRGGGVHGIEFHDESYFYDHDEMCAKVDYHAYKYVVRLKKNCGLL